MQRWILFVILLLLPCSYCSAQSLRESRAYAPTKTPGKPESPLPAITTSSPADHPSSTTNSTIPVGDSLQQLITKSVIEHAPREYENNKKWGGTKRVMSGLDWEFEGAKIETRRQWREANHGSWSMYRVKLVDAAEKFQVRLENLRDVGDNTAECDFIVLGTLHCFGRLAEWRRGVQLYSLSAEGEARVRLQSHVSMKMVFAGDALPPDILLSPKFTSAELILEDLQIQRVSRAEGPLVKQLSGLVESGVDDYLADHRQQLVDKLNAQLAKKQDKFRIPLSKLVESPWGSWFGDYFKNSKN
jgi:hypothetical protein